MGVRRALESEQEAMGQVAASAFWDEELLGLLMHPYRNEFPEDVNLYWLSQFRQAWSSPSNHFLVSTVDDTEAGGEQIVAMIQWHRKGAHEPQTGLARPYQHVPHINRAADPRYIDVIDRAYAFIRHEWSGSHAEAWDINWIAVRPEHQGKGHGKALVEWGIEQARREGVAVSVVSAKGKDGFYNRLGFNVRGATLRDGADNPLHDLIEGGQLWWMENFT